MNEQEFLTQMAKLKEAGLEAGIPNVTPLNGQFLYNLVRSCRASSILEVGTANGYSTMWLARAAKEFGGGVITIDQNLETIGQAKEHAAHFAVDDAIDFMQGEAETMIPYIKGPFDFVFIDARKRSYFEYFEGVLPNLAPHATVVFDDVLKFRHKMEDLYSYMEKHHPLHHVVLPIDGDDGIMIYTHQ